MGVLYIPNYAVQPIEYPCSIDFVRHIGTLYISSAWGFDVARFDRMGNFQEPQNVERATVQGFTLFFMSYLDYYWKTWGNGALNPINGLGIIKNG